MFDDFEKLGFQVNNSLTLTMMVQTERKKKGLVGNFKRRDTGKWRHCQATGAHGAVVRGNCLQNARKLPYFKLMNVVMFVFKRNKTVNIDFEALTLLVLFPKQPLLYKLKVGKFE